MSSLDFRGYKKWQRDNCGWHLNPSDKKVKRKQFRCVRRIIKTKTMKDGSVTVDGSLPTKVDFLIRQSAYNERKAREQRKEQRQTYHQCGNRRIQELKVVNPANHIYCNGSWGVIGTSNG